MIVKDHVPHYQRLAKYMQPEMLMLGRQSNTSGYKLPCEYKTLDPDGGDFKIDLSLMTPDEVTRHTIAWKTVFNLGTLEHIWDVHRAHINGAMMVERQGYFLGHVPVAGWEGHCIHVTDWRYVLQFYRLNGFVLEEYWLTDQGGNPSEPPARNGGQSLLLWFAARRVDVVPVWLAPSQVYNQGRKPQTPA